MRGLSGEFKGRQLSYLSISRCMIVVEDYMALEEVTSDKVGLSAYSNS